MRSYRIAKKRYHPIQKLRYDRIMSIPGPEQQKMIGEESKNKEREFQSAESCKKNSIQNLKNIIHAKWILSVERRGGNDKNKQLFARSLGMFINKNNWMFENKSVCLWFTVLCIFGGARSESTPKHSWMTRISRRFNANYTNLGIIKPL